MRNYCLFIVVLFFVSCRQKDSVPRSEKMNLLARNYVKLGLLIGQYDGDFVDAYYGPDSLKPVSPKEAVFPKDNLLKLVNRMDAELSKIITTDPQDSINLRAKWMVAQLAAFDRRIRLFSGEEKMFDEESADLFGVKAPVYDAAHYDALLATIDSLLPGKGTITDRYAQLAKKFTIPKSKLDTIFKISIAEARKRTLAHYTLPANESFTLEYVTQKPWSGYNWYQGNYKSIIQINTDLPIMIDRAIDLACHEGYPGHHVYNMLLEKNLYRDKGYLEISLYPLYSPQSLIAEGSANFGIEVAFPGNEQYVFTRDVLLPVAGIDTAGIYAYMQALSLKKELNYARNEAARGLLNGSMKDTAAIQWLMKYGLSTEEAALKSASFIKKYRSYVINYNYGQHLVKQYIEGKGGTENAPDKRWELFGWLLSNEVSTKDLLKELPVK